MTSENEDLVRRAFDAMSKGDQVGLLELVDPDLEWTFLDPSRENPEPQVCRGREQLAHWIGGEPGRSLELEEIVDYGPRVLVVTHLPGLDALRARKTGDRNFHVLTFRDGRLATLRACRSREEAEATASGG